MTVSVRTSEIRTQNGNANLIDCPLVFKPFEMENSEVEYRKKDKTER